MDWGWLAGLTVFAFAMAATPGPNNTMVAASGATYGMAGTLPLISGIAFGVAAIMLAVSAFGPSLVTHPMVGVTLKWIGVVYLLWLAWKIASAEPHVEKPDAAESGKTAPLSFSQGALFQFVNPKLWVMVAGAVATYGQTANEIGHAMLAAFFAFLFGTMTFISTIAWAALGASVRRFIASPCAVRTFNGAMAALLVASLIPIMLE